MRYGLNFNANFFCFSLLMISKRKFDKKGQLLFEWPMALYFKRFCSWTTWKLARRQNLNSQVIPIQSSARPAIKNYSPISQTIISEFSTLLEGLKLSFGYFRNERPFSCGIPKTNREGIPRARRADIDLNSCQSIKINYLKPRGKKRKN